MDIFDAVRGDIDAARHPAAAALIGRVHRDRDDPLFGEMLGIKAGGLFLHAAIGMRDDDRGVCLRRVVVRRGIDVGDDIEPMQLVCDRVDVDLARLVLRQRAVIDEGERILPVVQRRGDRFGGRCFAHKRHSYQCRGQDKRGGSKEIAPIPMKDGLGHFRCAPRQSSFLSARNFDT